MTTYVLSLSGDEGKAASAAPWAQFRQAKLILVSRRRGDPGPIDMAPGDGRPRVPAAGTHDPAALAALLVRTLDLQDGMGVVLADFDNEDVAADVVARIAALGRDVTCTSRVARFAFSARLRARFARS